MNSLSLVDSKHYYRGNIDCQPTFKYLYVYQKAFNILNMTISVNNQPILFIMTQLVLSWRLNLGTNVIKQNITFCNGENNSMHRLLS